MSKLETVWVFYGTDDAGNYYGPAVFDYPVTHDEIRAVLGELAPGVDVKIRVWKEFVNSKSALSEAGEIT